MYHGIDYAHGLANIDNETGIRYGVIPMNSLCEFAWEDFEADYGDPTCPKCGNEAEENPSHTESSDPPGQWVSVINDIPEERDDYEVLHHACGDYACDSCRILFDGEDAFGDEPCGHTLDDGVYKATVGSDGIDAFILSSPYYTRARFCSPCAPGACYLLNPTGKDGPKAYCLGHDWFEGGKAPYPIWRVENNEFVKPEAK